MIKLVINNGWVARDQFFLIFQTLKYSERQSSMLRYQNIKNISTILYIQKILLKTDIICHTLELSLKITLWFIFFVINYIHFCHQLDRKSVVKGKFEGILPRIIANEL